MKSEERVDKLEQISADGYKKFLLKNDLEQFEHRLDLADAAYKAGVKEARKAFLWLMMEIHDEPKRELEDGTTEESSLA